MIKKNDFIYIYLMIVIILFGSKLPNTDNIESINFNKNVLFLEENEEYQMPININGTDTLYKVVFSYSNEGIVEIDDMTMKALGVGHTKVTAELITDKSVISSIDVYVIDKPILASKTDQINVLESTEITFDNKENRDDYIWSVSDENIAVIDENYHIKGLKAGNVIITVTHKNEPMITSSYKIQVSTAKIDYANKLVEVALREVGYKEVNNYTKYGDWYGLPYEEWCAMFVSWSVDQAGIDTDIIPKFASVKAGKAFFENRDLFEYKGEYTPKKGDIIFFLNGISHAAIVTKVENGRVYTIEGNTAEKVAERNYSLNDSSITGYGTPNYNAN